MKVKRCHSEVTYTALFYCILFLFLDKAAQKAIILDLHGNSRPDLSIRVTIITKNLHYGYFAVVRSNAFQCLLDLPSPGNRVDDVPSKRPSTFRAPSKPNYLTRNNGSLRAITSLENINLRLEPLLTPFLTARSLFQELFFRSPKLKTTRFYIIFLQKNNLVTDILWRQIVISIRSLWCVCFEE